MNFKSGQLVQMAQHLNLDQGVEANVGLILIVRPSLSHGGSFLFIRWMTGVHPGIGHNTNLGYLNENWYNSRNIVMVEE